MARALSPSQVGTPTAPAMKRPVPVAKRLVIGIGNPDRREDPPPAGAANPQPNFAGIRVDASTMRRTPIFAIREHSM
jgi:hypothetical protein